MNIHFFVYLFADFQVQFEDDWSTLVKKAKAVLLLKPKNSADYKEAERFLKGVKEDKKQKKERKRVIEDCK